MRRRSLLATIATAGAAATAGCSGVFSPSEQSPSGGGEEARDTADGGSGGDSDSSTEEGGQFDVHLSSQDVRSSDPDYSLDVAWNARAQRTIDPPDETRGGAEDGHVWIVVTMRVTNTGDDPRELTAIQYVLNGEEQYEFVHTRSQGYLGGQTVSPGEIAYGWVLFHVPDDAGDLTLTAEQSHLAESFTILFEKDDSIEIPIPR